MENTNAILEQKRVPKRDRDEPKVEPVSEGIETRLIKDLKPLPELEGMMPIDDGDYRRLKEDIKERGIQVPLTITKENSIICGDNRWRIAKELGIEAVSCVVKELDQDDFIPYAIKDNLCRRQLRKKERDTLINLLNKYAYPQGRPKKNGQMSGLMSQEEIAQKVGVSDRTIRRIKEKSKQADKRPLFQKKKTKKIGKEFKYQEGVNDEIGQFLSDLASEYEKENIISVEVIVTVRREEIEDRNGGSNNQNGQFRTPNIGPQMIRGESHGAKVWTAEDYSQQELQNLIPKELKLQNWR